MDSIGQIALIVVLTLFGVLLLGFLLVKFGLRWWFGRMMRRAEAFSEHFPNTDVVARIHLRPLAAQAWQQADTQALIADAQTQGFIPAGRFEVPEVPTLRVWFGVQPESGQAISVYDHASLPAFFDVVRAYQDGALDCVSSNPVHNPDDEVPGSTYHMDPNFSVGQAWQHMQTLPQHGTLLPLQADTVVQFFEEAYARQMDHILTAKAPDAESLKATAERFARASGMPVPHLDDEQMQYAQMLVKHSRQAALEHVITQHFLESGEISAVQWHQWRDDVVIIHDKLDRDEVVALALCQSERDEDDAVFADVLASDAPNLMLFDSIQTMLPENQRLEYLGETSKPIWARLYRRV